MPTTPNDKIFGPVIDDSHYCHIMEDFIFINWNAGISGLQAHYPWRVDKVFTTADPEARINRTGNGEYYTILPVTAEIISTTLFWNNLLSIYAVSGPVIDFRLRAPTLTQNGDFIRFGLMSELEPVPDNIDNGIWLQYQFLGGFPTNIQMESDNGITDLDDQDSGTPWINNTYREYRIDCSVLTNCKFYYRGTVGAEAPWIPLPSPATHTMASATVGLLQPFVQVVKGATASVPSLLLDYVKVYWKRYV